MLEMLKKLGDNTYDGCLSDPPYGLTSIGKRFGKADSQPPKTDKGAIGAYGRLAKGFMGQTWDSSVPSIEVWQEIHRVSKPGAYLLAFGHPRSFHRLMCNIEDAGWVLRDCIMWIYGSGMPKGRCIDKDIDKKLGAERKVIGKYTHPRSIEQGKLVDNTWGEGSMNSTLQGYGGDERSLRKRLEITEPATHEAECWEGYHSGLKPAYEVVVVAQKKCEGSFAANVLKWGVGGLNIDGCRIGQDEITINRW